VSEDPEAAEMLEQGGRAHRAEHEAASESLTCSGKDGAGNHRQRRHAMPKPNRDLRAVGRRAAIGASGRCENRRRRLSI